MTGGPPLRRREALGVLGAAAILAGGGAYLGVAGTRSTSVRPSALDAGPPDAYTPGAAYAPDGTAGKTAAVPRADVRLLGGQFLGNQQRDLAYLLFLDPDRMLRSFRLNYGLPTRAMPIGGWESPASMIRGHVTGHLMSALAWAYAGTGTTASDTERRAVKAKGDYLVAQLASLQARAPTAGYGAGYLSAFPEQYFTWLEDGQLNRVWSPYYMIHKYLAGLIDQYQLAGQHPGARRGVPAGRLGRPPHQEPVLPAHAGDTRDRVRRLARGAGQPVRDHRGPRRP